MSQNRTVFRRSDGTWVNQLNGASRASSTHDAQYKAEDAARDMMQRNGGGELTTKGVDGRIRSKDTIKPGNESSRRDTEH